VDRKNGTSQRDRARPGDRAAIATYREFAPPPALRAHVRAFFSFMPGESARPPHRVMREVRFAREESFCSPLFASGQASLSLELGGLCALGKGWTFGAPLRGRAVGAQRKVGAPSPGGCSKMIGVYFEPGATSALLGVPALELTDRLVDLELLWGNRGSRMIEDLAALDEAAQLDRLGAELIQRLSRASPPSPGTDVAALARSVRAEPAAIGVRRLAKTAGVSRQHLTRLFREAIGVSPKRYCRLARFQAGLAYAGAGKDLRWAEVAVELGYADQSHMIAEFRELSSLTPGMLAGTRWFHPFILEAQSRAPNAGRRLEWADRRPRGEA
jgi:AraC-like DNA-binding protein